MRTQVTPIFFCWWWKLDRWKWSAAPKLLILFMGSPPAIAARAERKKKTNWPWIRLPIEWQFIAPPPPEIRRQIVVKCLSSPPLPDMTSTATEVKGSDSKICWKEAEFSRSTPPPGIASNIAITWLGRRNENNN